MLIYKELRHCRTAQTMTRETVQAAERAGAGDEACRWEDAGSTVLRGRPSATALVRPRSDEG